MIDCGVPNSASKRVYTGAETDVHEYPWVVGFKENIAGEVMCTGNIISRNLVLTSANCVM